MVLRFSPDSLRAVRKARGLTLRQLAAISGHSYVTIATTELGKSVPGVNVLADFAEALDTDICQFFEQAHADSSGGAR